jgi:thioesterase domain-containing protein
MELTEELKGKLKKSLATGIPAVARTGIEILEIDKGYVKMKMPFEPNINHVQIMYAGSLFTLAELPGGAIFATSFDSTRFYPIVRDMSIRFRRPAKTDITVEVRLDPKDAAEIAERAERDGKADYEWECELKDETGEVVAITKNIYQLRRIGS